MIKAKAALGSYQLFVAVQKITIINIKDIQRKLELLGQTVQLGYQSRRLLSPESAVRTASMRVICPSTPTSLKYSPKSPGSRNRLIKSNPQVQLARTRNVLQQPVLWSILNHRTGL